MSGDLRGKVAAKRQQQDNGSTDGGNGNGTVAKRDEARELLESMSSEFAAALPRLVPIEAFMRVALTGLKTTPGLATCSRQSLLAALLKCAASGLLPCTEQAAIVPFGNVATYIPQYQGYIEIFHRTGKVARVELDWIYEADRWDYVKGDNPIFRHWPNMKTPDRGEITHAYAFLRYKDGTRSDIIILNRAQAEKIRDKSKAYIKAEREGKESTWHSSFDAMWLKSCIRRLAKYVPKSPELRALLAEDEPDDATDYSSPPTSWGSTVPGEVIRDATSGEQAATPEGDDGWPVEDAPDWPEVPKPGESQ